MPPLRDSQTTGSPGDHYLLPVAKPFLTRPTLRGSLIGIAILVLPPALVIAFAHFALQNLWCVPLFLLLCAFAAFAVFSRVPPSSTHSLGTYLVVGAIATAFVLVFWLLALTFLAIVGLHGV